VKTSKNDMLSDYANAKAPELMQQIIDHYASHGHHKKEFRTSINEARADSDKKFRSSSMKKLCSETESR